MKQLTIYKFLVVLSATVMIFTACTKEQSNVKLDPKLSTSQIADITSTSANVSGFVVAAGDGFSEKGVCYDVVSSPTVASNKVVFSDASNTKATFTVALTSLAYNTKYYVRAYATNSEGTIYGEELNFTTLINLPFISLTTASSIAEYTATSGGEVTNEGGGVVSDRGVCWSRNASPTTADSKTTDGSGLGVFTSNLTNLRGGTLYHYRAYAKNQTGTTYSDELTFTTLPTAPYITTVSAQGFETSASVSCEVTHDGGDAITERGVCYSTNANPTTADGKVTKTGTTGTYDVTITGLTSNTTYHVRAYAINSKGTSYGDDKSFATYPPNLYMTGDGVGLDAENWNWSEPLQLIPVHSHPELFWKIVWMKGSGAFKFAPQAAWSGGDFGITGSATNGVYAKGGDNVPVPGVAGYYMVVVDLKNNTVEVNPPKVYGMGDVFGGWTTGVPANLFTVDNTNKEIKFTSFAHDGELRMYVAATTLACDWWQAEFILLSGNIAFRGNGGDQTRVSVTTGQSISLNFRLGTGAITSK